MNKILLVPCARLIPEELRVDFGELPSGLIPLRGKPALQYILKAYEGAGFESKVAVGDQSWLVRDYLERHPELDACPLTVGRTQSLAETILLAIDQIGSPEYLAIHFADTLIDTVPSGEDCFYYDVREDRYRWTTFTLSPSGSIDQLTEKNRIKSDGAQWLTFVGVFAFADPDCFRALLIRHLAYPDGEIDAFYAAVQDYYNGTDFRAIQVGKWYDLGHLDTYYRTARGASFLNGRAFNSLEVDQDRGIICKTSSRESKLQAELDWYLNLPNDLSHLAPRVLKADRYPGPKFELEFYAYPALADAFLYGNWDLGAWEGALSAIGVASDAMAAHTAPASETSRRESALSEMYVDKTLERLAQFADTNPLGRRETIVLNGCSYPGIPSLLRDFRGVVRRSGLLDDTPFCVIHGDLCLSNILYDRRGGFVRLVDPRGSFGSYSIHGDPRYDLAKLAHSLDGGYDLLVNEVFELKESDSSFQLNLLATPGQRALRQMFLHWLAGRTGNTLDEVRLIESLLFLSMLPLHYDRPRAQTAFLLTGLQMFWETVAVMRQDEVAYA